MPHEKGADNQRANRPSRILYDGETRLKASSMGDGRVVGYVNPCIGYK